MTPGTDRLAEARLFRAALHRKIHDPGKIGLPASPAAMLRDLSVVVSNAHEIDRDGNCTSCVSAQGSLAIAVEWPCDEIIRMGRIYGVWWARP